MGLTAMTDHYIICGMGHVGFRVAGLLRRLGEPVTVVTRQSRADWVHAAESWGVVVIYGDASDQQLLAAAGLRCARGVIVATDRDLTNIEILLDIKQLRPDLPVVLRLYDPTLARQMEATFDIRRAMATAELAAPSFAAAALDEQIVGSFTLDDTLYVIGRLSPEADTRRVHETLEAGGVASSLAVLPLEDVRGTEPEAEEAAGDRPSEERATLVGDMSSWHRLVQRGNPAPQHPVLHRRLANLRQSLRASTWLAVLRRVWSNTPLLLRTAFLLLNLFFLVSVVVFRAAAGLTPMSALYFVVQTVTSVGYGDVVPPENSGGLRLYACLLMLLGVAATALLYSILTDFVVVARLQQLTGHQGIVEEGHTVVAGLGNVGYRIVDELRRAGARVVAVERDPEARLVESARSLVPVLIGDARLTDTLMKAGVSRACAVVAATNDDAVNLSIGLAAKQINPGLRTVLRLFDPDFARKVQSGLNLDTALSAATIAAASFVAAALFPGLRGAFVLEDRLYAIVQREAGEEWQGLTPSHLRRERGALVLLRRPPGTSGFALSTDEVPLEREESLVVAVWRDLQPLSSPVPSRPAPSAGSVSAR